MKRIVVGVMMQESNSFSVKIAKREDFKTRSGPEMLSEIPVVPLFEAAGYEVVPSLYARAVPGGRVDREAFRSFADEIVSAARPGETDAVWLYLHGAMEVVGLGSGEAALLTALREKLGWELPIAVALDFHANNTPELVSCANIIIGYKTAPHEDEEETQLRAAELLLWCLKEKTLPHPVRVRIPMLITGEQETTPLEPMRTLMGKIRELECRSEVLCASYFGGMAWVDTLYSGVSIVVVPRPGCEEAVGRMAEELAREAWAARSRFGFEEETFEAAEALRQALGSAAAGIRPVFITDSGDNVTAGAAGDSAFFVRLAAELQVTSTLIAGVTDRPAVEACRNTPLGSGVCLTIGGTPRSGLSPICVLRQAAVARQDSGQFRCARFRRHSGAAFRFRQPRCHNNRRPLQVYEPGDH